MRIGAGWSTHAHAKGRANILRPKSSHTGAHNWHPTTTFRCIIGVLMLVGLGTGKQTAGTHGLEKVVSTH